MPDSVEVAIVAYGSPNTGTGHLRRSSLLRTSLEDADVDARLIAVGPASFVEEAISLNAEVRHSTDEMWVSEVSRTSCNLLVLDLPWPNQEITSVIEYLKQAIVGHNSRGTSVVSIGRPALEVPEIRTFIDLYPSESPSSMSGVVLPALTPIAPQLMASGRRARAGGSPERGHVFVSMGGSDPFGMLLTSVEAIAEVEGVKKVTILATSQQQSPLSHAVASLNRKGISVEALVDVEPEAVGEALVAAQVCVVAFGTTAFEAVALGMPTLTAAHYTYQLPAAQWFAALGMLKEYGAAESGVDWNEIAVELGKQINSAAPISRTGVPSLIDGEGMAKLTRELCQLLREAKAPKLDHLYVFAHPGNEVQNAGGSIAHFASRGERVGVVYIGDGITSRLSDAPLDVRARWQVDLESAVTASRDVLGFETLYWLRNQDNDFVRLSLAKLSHALSVILARHRPRFVWTHARGELNQDHDVALRAVRIATRESSPDRCAIFGCISPAGSTWSIGSTQDRAQVSLSLSESDLARARAAFAAYEGVSYWRQHPETWESWEAVRRYFAASGPDQFTERFVALDVDLSAWLS